jgi:AhpD family alkylhydroperoxidase
MQARIDSPAVTIPGLYPAMMELSKSIKAAAKQAGVAEGLLHLIFLRASQINGCGLCVDMHWRDAVKAGESDERVHGVAAFREMPFFTDAERSALALVESTTRIADKGDAVPDAIWDEASQHWSPAALGVLVAATALINTWNRFNAPTRQPAGAWRR